MSSICPSPELIQSLFKGTRPPENARALLSHVERCEACREKLAGILPELELHPAFALAAPATAVAGPGAPTVSSIFEPLTEVPKQRADFTPPRRLGHYEVVRVLGSGGMGFVVKALDPALNRFVAIKSLMPRLAHDNSYRQRFLREARSAARIGSDHVTSVFAIEEQDGCPYMVMEYVLGEDLQTRLNREGRLPVPLAISITRQVALGLMAAHAQGVIHRDIKPGNVMLELGVGCPLPLRVKLTDFGIARAEGLPVLTSAHEAMGTPEYMSPEQVSGGAVDARSDLYAVGLLVFQMVTGRLPFKASNPLSYFTQHLTKAPPPPREFAPDLPEWLDTLILQLLSKEPADRVQSAEELIRRLDAGCTKECAKAPDAEAKRLAALRSYEVLDTEAEQAFDDLTFLASHICGTPIAALSLIDEDRQWFKSKVGLSVNQTARNISFCQYTIRGTTPLIVGNAATDPQFADNPLVKSEPSIRFYAGVPLINPEGCALGSLCVIDRVVRGLSSEQLAALSALGRLVMNLLNNRRDMLERRERDGGAAK